MKKRTFVKERHNTDQSLSSERENTNRSLASVRDRTESKTDGAVKSERATADLKKVTARNGDDAKNDYAESTKKSILEERKRSDEAVEVERSRVDTAIDHEREVKRTLAGKILKQERELTDQNLAEERNVTDSHVASGSARLSEEVAEHSKTKSSLTTRDEFLAIVSHDLRNPIGAIASCMEMLLDEIAERKIDPQTKQWLELAKRNADSSLRMISDILDMERVVNGKIAVSLGNCEIGPLINEAMGNFVQAAAAKNVLLRSIPTDVKCVAVCDRDRLTQVVSNLINNALKFTPEQGKVVVKTVADDYFVTISVCDTGPGIPDYKKDEIFEKFAQLRSKDRTGLGLGLHISKMLVEAHGGTLTVESVVGKGSTFFVKLPLKQIPSGTGLSN